MSKENKNHNTSGGLIQKSHSVDHVYLEMYAHDTIENGAINPLKQEFFGSTADYLATYIDFKAAMNNHPAPDSNTLKPTKQENSKLEYIYQREIRKKNAFLKNNPDTEGDLYDEYRSKQVEKFLARARRKTIKTFYNAVTDKFQTKEDPKIFANRQLQYGAYSLAKVANIIDPDSGTLRLKNETELLPPSPAKVVERIGSIKTHPKLKQEEIRRHLNAHISAELDSRNGRQHAEIKLSQIQELLDEEIFLGQHGETQNMIIRGVYENETNSPEIIEGIDGDIDENNLAEGKHIKEMALSMRQVQVGDKKLFVYTNPDIKDQGTGIIKAIKKAAIKKGDSEGDGEIKAEEVVKDTHRILFAVYGDQQDRDDFAKLVWTTLADDLNQNRLANRDEADEPIKINDFTYSGQLLQIFNQSKTNGHTTNSENVEYRRLAFEFDGLEVPIEIIFQDMKSFQRSEFEVGNYDPNKKKYTGAAHDLYELYRTAITAPYLINGGAETNLEERIHNTEEKIVFNLRNQTKKVK